MKGKIRTLLRQKALNGECLPFITGIRRVAYFGQIPDSNHRFMQVSHTGEIFRHFSAFMCCPIRSERVLPPGRVGAGRTHLHCPTGHYRRQSTKLPALVVNNRAPQSPIPFTCRIRQTLISCAISGSDFKTAAQIVSQGSPVPPPSNG